MTVHSTKMHERRLFHAELNDTLQPYYFFSNTGTGAKAVVGDGLELSVPAANDKANISIINKPFTLEKLRSFDAIVKPANMGADERITFGVGGDYNADKSLMIPHIAAVIGLSEITISWRLDASNVWTETQPFSLVNNSWYRMCWNFWMRTQTVSPPGTSRGYQAVFSIQDHHGFAKDYTPKSFSIDGEAIKDTEISSLLELDSGAGASSATMVISEQGWERRSEVG